MAVYPILDMTKTIRIFPLMKDRKSIRFFGASHIDAPIAREAYASDASIYRIHPLRIICPTTEEQAVVEVASALSDGVSITPRGGGTGLAGGALGKGVIIDCSRLTAIKHISIDNKTVSCQTGIIYQDLNLALKDAGLFFPPDPSSGDSCQIGGMLANNSSGPRSVKYGLTSDYIEELTVVGKDGRPIHLKKYRLGGDELAQLCAQYPAYGTVLRLLQEHRELILSRWPRVKKNSAGYNLRQVIDELDRGLFHLPALYVGSEGTFGLFLSAVLRLLPLPSGNRSFRLFFDTLEQAGSAVAPLLATEPSSLEIVDGATLNLIGRQNHRAPLAADAMLLLEYDDDLDQREARLNAEVAGLRLSAPLERAASEHERLILWAARKAIVPTLYRHHVAKRPLPFIEDASLPVEKLTEFIAWVGDRLRRENLTFGLYGHIGDGNLHIRPLLDLHVDADLRLTERLYDEVYEKIFSLGGSSTAEHADGRLRAPVVRRLYGDEIYDLFVLLKSLLDPRNLFNPDVILAERRFGDDIDLQKLELTCAACGKCNGYCPAFEIFRREDMSARGWLRMLKFGGIENAALGDWYRYCLNCRNCAIVCPAGVDIAREILRYKADRPDKTARRIIALFDRPTLFSRFLAAGSYFYPISRITVGRKITALLGRRFGLDDKAIFPRPARRTLRDRHPDLCRAERPVALFHGCADNYFTAAAGDALIKVFAHFGYEPALPPQQCCGLPMEVYGHRENMIEKAKYNIDALSGFDTVVFTCASCLHRLAEYHLLFEPGTEYHGKASALAKKLYDPCQFLRLRNVTIPESAGRRAVRLTYHHPCHLRAAGLEQEPIRLLTEIARIDILHPEGAGRCCGQAGSFGYFHYQEGMAVFAPKKAEYEEMGAEVIVSSCPACISKIAKEMGDGVRVCHPLEIIADLIEGKPLHE
jgi:FAD/FMN-containing dehydrogenase/Fe-S oxidoreductase